MGVLLKRDSRTMLSDVNRLTQEVVGMDGLADFGNDSYKEKSFELTLEYDYFSDWPGMRKQMRRIGGWLYDDGQYHQLIFDDEPDVYYMAKVTNSVTYSQNDAYCLISVTFTCNPPHPFLIDGNRPLSPADVQSQLLWNTARLDNAGMQYFQDFSADGIMKFTVGGARSIRPVIKLTGYIKSGIALSFGTSSLKYNADLIYDEIKIDCNAKTVTQISNGANLFSNLDPNQNTFFEIPPGQQQIGISGVSGAFPHNIYLMVDTSPTDF